MKGMLPVDNDAGIRTFRLRNIAVKLSEHPIEALRRN